MKQLKAWGVLGVLVVIGMAVGGSGPQWRWHGQPILSLSRDGSTLELGLRDNGTVVWREVTQTTNSPSENTPPWWTNVFIVPGYTNNELRIGPGLMMTNTVTNVIIQTKPKQWFNGFMWLTNNVQDNLDLHINTNDVLWDQL